MTLDQPATASRDAPIADPDALQARFARHGFVGPVRVFTATECRRIATYLGREGHPAPADWPKGRAVHERFIYELATHPAVLSRVTALLGPDVILWGASAVSRGPGAIHPWHSDIESCGDGGRFATVWIGVEHTRRESALQLITGSPRLGKTVQEARLARGVGRDEATAEFALALARDRDSTAALVQPDMTDGEAIVFDGSLWHGSDNRRKEGRRLALLFQYAAAETPVRIPDPQQLDWPFRFRETPLPATILVSGTSRLAVNRVVPAPPPSSGGTPMIATAIHRFELPPDAPTPPWRTFPAFRGPTRTIADMSCHASLLAPGHSPHPPHAHREEELLIPLRGEVEVVIAEGPDDPAPTARRVGPGAFLYYPAGQHHTIRNPGPEPAGYLMFKWFTPPARAGTPLPVGEYRYGAAEPPTGAPGFWTLPLLDGPTACLGRLQAHLTVLRPGAGYEPNVKGD